MNNNNIIFDKSDCERIRCEFLICPGVCKKKGDLPKYFQCRELDIAEARHEAGLKW